MTQNPSDIQEPKISVLMTVYNTENYVGDAITSILNQTLTDLELIIVDDCSKDNSWAIISIYAARDARIISVQNEENRGLSRSLNHALKLARSQYITRQDSDDYSLAERLAEQVGFLEANPDVGAVGTAVSLVDSENTLLKIDQFPANDTDIQLILPDRMCFCGPTLMVRRHHFETAGLYFDERFSGSDDYDQCLRLSEVAKMANLLTPLYGYRQHSASMSHQKRYKLMFRKAAALEAAMYRRYGSEPDASYLALVARDYLRAAVLAYGSSEMQTAVTSLQHALTFNPILLDQPSPLEEILRKYTPQDNVHQAIAFINGIFHELLPSSSILNRLRAKLLADLHMKEVFTGVNLNQPQHIDAHLWPGIRENPRWLLNRGVATLAVKRLLRLT